MNKVWKSPTCNIIYNTDLHMIIQMITAPDTYVDYSYEGNDCSDEDDEYLEAKMVKYSYIEYIYSI